MSPETSGDLAKQLPDGGGALAEENATTDPATTREGDSRVLGVLGF